MKRLARALSALLVMAILLVGVPTLLLRVDLASTIQDATSNPGDFARSPLSDSALLGLLALIGWICWFLTVLAFAVETWGVSRGRPFREFAGLAVPQRFARVVAGWLFVGGVAFPASVPALQVLMPAEPVVVEFSNIAAVTHIEAETTQVTPVPVAEPSLHVVVKDDNLWELAEQYLGDGLRWRELFALNEGVEQADGKCLSDPNLILVGWELKLPANVEAGVEANAIQELDEPEELEDVQEIPLPVVIAPSSDQPSMQVPEPASLLGETDPELMWIEPLEIEVSESSSVALVLSAGSVLAAGALIESERRRRIRRRSYSSYLAPSPLDERMSALKRQVTSQASDLPTGIGHFWESLRNRSARVLAARVSEKTMAILVEDESLLPPWVQSNDGWWEIARGDVLDGSETTWPELLLSVGESPDLVLVDLGSLRSVRILGSDQDWSQLLEALLLQLRSSGPGPKIDFILVGELSRFADQQDRLSPSLNSSKAELDARSIGSEETLVVVVGSDDPDLKWAMELAANGGFVLLVMGDGAAPCELTMSLEQGSIRFGVADQTDRVVESQGFGLSSAEVLAIRELLNHYERDGLTAEAIGVAPIVEPSSAQVAQEIDLLTINLLGDVSVSGLRSTLPPQQLAILVYLYLHPRATGEAIQDAVWGGVKPSSQRFKNVISSMRSVLGYEHFPVAESGRYSLGPGVSSDMELFERLTKEGSLSGSQELKEALDLVDGVPMSLGGPSVRHFGWVDIENLGSYWELQILRAAITLVERLIDAEEFDAATTSARQGLKGCPLNEELTRLLIRAHLGAGQQRIAGEVAGELVRALDELGVDELEAETELLLASMGSASLLS